MSEGYQVNTLAISILVEFLTIFRGNDLKELVTLGREGTTVILDEVSKKKFWTSNAFLCNLLLR